MKFLCWNRLKSVLSVICAMIFVLIISACEPNFRKEKIPPVNSETEDQIKALYKACSLSEMLRFDIFRRAVVGAQHMKLKKRDIISIIDYTRPSSEKRLFVINLKDKKVLYNTLVAHGRNSGNKYAKKFSNRVGSKQSSLGFYLTAKTYVGKHGYSLRLDGVEKGINDLARKRAIVIHGAAYANNEFVKQHGRLGRSWGCPALPEKMSRQIIDTIKVGCCLYAHADDSAYSKKSYFVEVDTPLTQ